VLWWQQMLTAGHASVRNDLEEACPCRQTYAMAFREALLRMEGIDRSDKNPSWIQRRVDQLSPFAVPTSVLRLAPLVHGSQGATEPKRIEHVRR